MQIVLDYDQWKLLRRLVQASSAIEQDSTTGELLWADPPMMKLEIYEKIKITLPD